MKLEDDSPAVPVLTYKPAPVSTFEFLRPDGTSILRINCARGTVTYDPKSVDEDARLFLAAVSALLRRGFPLI